jgi:hypothetical protein
MRFLSKAPYSFSTTPTHHSQLVSKTRCHLLVGGTLMYYTEILKKECWHLMAYRTLGQGI